MNEQIVDQQPLPQGAAFERHYSVREIARLWGFGIDLVRRMFATEPGVIRITHPETCHKRK